MGTITTWTEFRYWRTIYAELCVVATYREWTNLRQRAAGIVFGSLALFALSAVLVVTLAINGPHLYASSAPMQLLPDQPNAKQLAWVGVAATAFSGIAGWQALRANGLGTLRLIGVTCLTLVVAVTLQVIAGLLRGPDTGFRIQLLQAAAAVFLVQALIVACATLLYSFCVDFVGQAPQENLLVRCLQFAGLAKNSLGDSPTELPDIHRRKELIGVVDGLKRSLLQAAVGELRITDAEVSRLSLRESRGPLQRLSELQLMIALPDRQRRAIVRADAASFLAAAVCSDLYRCPSPATVPPKPTRGRLLGSAALTFLISLLPAVLLLTMVVVSDKLPGPVIAAAFLLSLAWLVVILAQLSGGGAPAVLKQVAAVFGLIKGIAEPKKESDTPAPAREDKNGDSPPTGPQLERATLRGRKAFPGLSRR